MDLRVNGKPLSLTLEGALTFGDVMRVLYKKVVDEATVVTRVTVNGETLSEEREKILGSLPKEDITTLELQTKHPLDLAHESMQTGLEYVAKLVEALRLNVRSLRLKDARSTEQDFQSCLDGLHWFFELVSALKAPLRITGDEKVTEIRTFQQVEEQSISAIHELCDARERSDNAALADAIEYELLPTLELWRQWMLRKTDIDVAMRELQKKHAANGNTSGNGGATGTS